MRSFILPSPMTRQEKSQMASQMANFAMSKTDGGMVDDPATWRDALDQLGCNVLAINDQSGSIAWYAPAFEESGRYPLGEVVYNLAQSPLTQARGLAHEYGHALLQKWVPEFIFDCDVVYSYHDDCRSVRHQIAQMFEKLMVG